MALTKSTTQGSLGSGTNAAGGTSNSSAVVIGYGCSIIVTITNGSTGPTVPASATLQVQDSAGSGWNSTDDVRTAGPTASAASTFVFNLGVGGVDCGDWYQARIQIAGNTGQSVTYTVVESHTSGL